MSYAETPNGIWVLGLVAFLESSVFPIPPDLFIIALGVARPKHWVRLAIVATIASVAGGAFGYAIGWGFWENVQGLLIPRIFSAETFQQVVDIYNTHGIPFVFLAAFTPIPYKVFTIVAGIAKLNLVAFLVASLIGRGARFFLVAYIVKRFGPQARHVIEKNFGIATFLGGLLILGGYYALKMLRH